MSAIIPLDVVSFGITDISGAGFFKIFSKIEIIEGKLGNYAYIFV